LRYRASRSSAKARVSSEVAQLRPSRAHFSALPPGRVEIDGLAPQQPGDDVVGGVEHVHGGVPLDPEGRLLVPDLTAAEPDLQPAAAEQVEGAELLGHAHRVAKRQDGDHGADAQPGGLGRDGRCDDVRRRGEREGRLAVVLGQVPAVDAELFGPPDEPEQVVHGVGVRPAGVGAAEYESVVVHDS
jgi:hypothetical protein